MQALLLVSRAVRASQGTWSGSASSSLASCSQLAASTCAWSASYQHEHAQQAAGTYSMAPTGLRQARELTTSLQPCASGSRQQLRHRTGSLHHSQCACGTCHRKYSSGAPTDAAWVAKEVEEINTLFVEARDEIDYAKEDSETTYFNESVNEAKKCVDTCLQRWTALLESLPEEEKQRLQRSMGLKMEQLKAEFDVLKNTHLE